MLSPLECDFIRSLSYRPNDIAAIVHLNDERFEKVKEDVFPCICHTNKLDSLLIKISEDDNWNAGIMINVGNSIKAGDGPFLDELLRGTRCWPCYVTVRLALVRNAEMDEAMKNYHHRSFSPPKWLVDRKSIALVACCLGCFFGVLLSVCFHHPR